MGDRRQGLDRPASASTAHQRPELERDGDALFVVLRAARAAIGLRPDVLSVLFTRRDWI